MADSFDAALAALKRLIGMGEKPAPSEDEALAFADRYPTTPNLDVANRLAQGAGMVAKPFLAARDSLAEGVDLAQRAGLANSLAAVPVAGYEAGKHIVKEGINTGLRWLDATHQLPGAKATDTLVAPTGTEDYSINPNRVEEHDVLAPLGLAGMMSPGSLAARGTSVGMFGGKLAAENLAKAGRPAGQQALEMAESMAAKGASREEIWKATTDFLGKNDPELIGVYKGSDGMWRLESDDSALRTKLSRPGDTGREAIADPAFDAAYPPDKHYVGAQVQRGLLPEGSSVHNYLDTDRTQPFDIVNVKGLTQGSRDRTAAHERQHVAQDLEGFSPGGNIYFNTHDEYRKIPGEIEARNVAQRLRMTAAERRATPPWETESSILSAAVKRSSLPGMMANAELRRMGEEDVRPPISGGASNAAQAQAEMPRSMAWTNEPMGFEPVGGAYAMDAARALQMAKGDVAAAKQLLSDNRGAQNVVDYWLSEGVNPRAFADPARSQAYWDALEKLNRSEGPTKLSANPEDGRGSLLGAVANALNQGGTTASRNVEKVTPASETKVYYHGTTADTDQLKGTTYYSSDPSEASGFAGKNYDAADTYREGGRVFPVSVNLKKPLVYDSSWYQGSPPQKLVDELIAQAKGEGRDGVILKFHGKEHAIVFDPASSTQPAYAGVPTLGRGDRSSGAADAPGALKPDDTLYSNKDRAGIVAAAANAVDRAKPPLRIMSDAEISAIEQRNPAPFGDLLYGTEKKNTTPADNFAAGAKRHWIMRGDEPVGFVTVLPEGNTAHIAYMKLDDAAKERFGMGDMRALREEFRKIYPEINKFEGYRVSGAHSKADKKRQSVTIKSDGAAGEFASALNNVRGQDGAMADYNQTGSFEEQLAELQRQLAEGGGNGGIGSDAKYPTAAVSRDPRMERLIQLRAMRGLDPTPEQGAYLKAIMPEKEARGEALSKVGAELSGIPQIGRAASGISEAVQDPTLPNVTNAAAQTALAAFRPVTAAKALGLGYAGALATDLGLLPGMSSAEAQTKKGGAPKEVMPGLSTEQQSEYNAAKKRLESGDYDPAERSILRDTILNFQKQSRDFTNANADSERQLKAQAEKDKQAEYNRAVSAAEAARDKEFARDRRFSDTEVGKVWEKTGGLGPALAGLVAGKLSRAATGPGETPVGVAIKDYAAPLASGTLAGGIGANLPLAYNALFTEPDNPKKRGYEAYVEALPPDHPRRQEFKDYAAGLPQANPVRTAASEEFYNPEKLKERMTMGGIEGFGGGLFGTDLFRAMGRGVSGLASRFRGPGGEPPTTGPGGGATAGTAVENALARQPTSGLASSADILPPSGASRNALAGPERLADRIKASPLPEPARLSNQSGLPEWASEPPQGVKLPSGYYWDTKMQQPRHKDGTLGEMPKYSVPKGRKEAPARPDSDPSETRSVQVDDMRPLKYRSED